MSGLFDFAVTILSQSERRVATAADNIANGSTPAFKRKISFSSLLGGGGTEVPVVQTATDTRPGKMVVTGNPTDLALSGLGFFAVRHGDHISYSRNGQFVRDQDGHLVDSQGGVLLQSDGSDVVIATSSFEIGRDGRIAQEGRIVGRIAVYDRDSIGSRDDVPALIDRVSIQQGAFEASNVSVGEEMVSLMEGVRRAEAGQRVMSVYDDLMGRVISSYGDGGR